LYLIYFFYSLLSSLLKQALHSPFAWSLRVVRKSIYNTIIARHSLPSDVLNSLNYFNFIPKIKLSNNDLVSIRVHLKNKDWLPWINKWDNTNSGYAGIKGNDIDGIQIKSTKHDMYYRAHTINGKWLSWINKVDDTSSGYAGIYGKSIDAIQVYIGIIK